MRFERSNAIEICNGIMFDFYLWLLHILLHGTKKKKTCVWKGLTWGCCWLVLRLLFHLYFISSYSQCRRNFLVLKCTFWVKFCAAYIIPHPRNLKIAHFTQHHVDQLVMDTTSLELIQSRFPGEENHHVTLCKLNRNITWKRKVVSCANLGLLAWTATDHLATNAPQNPLI